MPSLNLAYSRPVAGCEADAVCGDCQVRGISVCQPLTPHELQRLRAIITTVHVETGRPILREGEPAEVLYNVVAGALKLYKLLRVRAWLFSGGTVSHDDLRLLSYVGETHQEMDLLAEKVPQLLGV